jgi:hypothetical protein
MRAALRQAGRIRRRVRGFSQRLLDDTPPAWTTAGRRAGRRRRASSPGDESGGALDLLRKCCSGTRSWRRQAGGRFLYLKVQRRCCDGVSHVIPSAALVPSNTRQAAIRLAVAAALGFLHRIAKERPRRPTSVVPCRRDRASKGHRHPAAPISN